MELLQTTIWPLRQASRNSSTDSEEKRDGEG